jgi:hypothetical protein
MGIDVIENREIDAETALSLFPKTWQSREGQSKAAQQKGKQT